MSSSMSSGNDFQRRPRATVKGILEYSTHKPTPNNSLTDYFTKLHLLNDFFLINFTAFNISALTAQKTQFLIISSCDQYSDHVDNTIAHYYILSLSKKYVWEAAVVA
jgi:hypothetical protein